MRIGITNMPTDNIEIYRLTGDVAIVRLYKDEQTEVIADDTHKTADVVELQMVYYDGLKDEVLTNFETYFAMATEKEAVKIKEQKQNEIKQFLLKANVDYFDGKITETEFTARQNELKAEYELL